MAQTKAALIKAALEEVLRLGTGQPVDAEDSAAVDGLVGPMIDALRQGRVITIANVDAIPDWAFGDLVKLLAQDIVAKFGGARDADAAALARASLAQLAKLSRTGATPLVIAVLEELALMGAASIPVDAVMIARDIPGLLANLAGRDIIYIADASVVEDGQHPAFKDLAAWLATQVAPEPFRSQSIVYEARLRRLKAREATNRPLRLGYF